MQCKYYFCFRRRYTAFSIFQQRWIQAKLEFIAIVVFKAVRIKENEMRKLFFLQQTNNNNNNQNEWTISRFFLLLLCAFIPCSFEWNTHEIKCIHNHKCKCHVKNGNWLSVQNFYELKNWEHNRKRRKWNFCTSYSKFRIPMDPWSFSITKCIRKMNSEMSLTESRNSQKFRSTNRIRLDHFSFHFINLERHLYRYLVWICDVITQLKSFSRFREILIRQLFIAITNKHCDVNYSFEISYWLKNIRHIWNSKLREIRTVQSKADVM